MYCNVSITVRYCIVIGKQIRKCPEIVYSNEKPFRNASFLLTVYKVVFLVSFDFAFDNIDDSISCQFLQYK